MPLVIVHLKSKLIIQDQARGSEIEIPYIQFYLAQGYIAFNVSKQNIIASGPSHDYCMRIQDSDIIPKSNYVTVREWATCIVLLICEGKRTLYKIVIF